MIEAQKLTKSFGNYKVLEDLNLKVKKSSVYGLLGPNGAGKTTLIKHLTGLYRQDQGLVSIDDQPVYENPQVKAQMIYIPDDLYFFSQSSIDEMAKFYSKIYPAWNWNRYEQLKQVFPIDSKRRVVKLSKGMQKQLAFWLGISSMPKVMILDEPVDGLDPVMRKKVWSLILQDVAERQVTVLVSSHNLRELEDVCDHIGILHNGKIVVERELDDMKSDVHKFQLGFAGDIPEGFLAGPKVLHRTQTGSILLLIARGDKNELLQKMKSANPVILDVLPLTLEEIFIYELGGMGYDIQNIII